MRKKIMIFLLALLCSVQFAGCASIGHEQIREKTMKELEPYKGDTDEKKEDSKYQYLASVTLGDEDYSVQTYLPDTNELKTEKDTASSSKDGVSVLLRFFQETKDTTAGSVLQTAYQAEKDRIEAIQGMQDFQTYDLIEKDGYWLMEMDYSINDGNGSIYPCISVLKMDQLDGGYYLLSSINIDNSKANEETTEVLKELLNVYGVTLK